MSLLSLLSVSLQQPNGHRDVGARCQVHRRRHHRGGHVGLVRLSSSLQEHLSSHEGDGRWKQTSAGVVNTRERVVLTVFDLFQVNSNTILGASGDYADYQYLKQIIDQMV